MAKALQDVLGWVALGRAIEAVRDGVPNPFPPWLFTVRAESRVIGNSVKFNRRYGERRTARLAEYGAAARNREMKKEELIEAKLLHLLEKQPIDPLVMQQLRDYENYDNQMKGMRVVAHNVKTFGTLFANTRIAAVASSLNLGTIYWDSSGNLLPSSSSAAQSHSQQIPAANIGSVTDNSSNGIFGATGTGGSWALNTTDIPLQLRRLIELADQNHGYTPKVALYGKNVPTYLIQNDFVLDYLARTPTMAAQWVTDNTIPDGLLGFTWVPAWRANYEDANGTKQSLWGSNRVTFMPGDSQTDWWEMFEGSYLVPRNLNIVADAEAAMADMELVYGSFGYGTLTYDPPSVATHMGDTFFPAIKVPEAVYLVDVIA